MIISNELLAPQINARIGLYIMFVFLGQGLNKVRHYYMFQGKVILFFISSILVFNISTFP